MVKFGGGWLYARRVAKKLSSEEQHYVTFKAEAKSPEAKLYAMVQELTTEECHRILDIIEHLHDD